MGLPAGSIVKVAVEGLLLGQQTVTSWWYRVRFPGASATVIADLDGLLTYFVANVNAPYQAFLACLPSTWDGQFCSAQQITPALSVRRDVTLVPDAGGRGVTNSSNLSAVVTKGTDQGGRDQIGSFHLPGIADDDQVAGSVSAALLALMGTFASKSLNVLTDPVTAVVYEPILVHRITPSVGSTGTLLTRARAQETIRVMRRRTVGVGK